MSIIHEHSPKSSSISIKNHRPELFRGQKGRILRLLLDNKNKWVPAYKLANEALQYAARICELRSNGYAILNKTERINGQVHGSYMLTGCPGEQLTQGGLF